MTSDELRAALAKALPPHQHWCHGEAHAECCGAGDCDCGIADALDALLPVVSAYAERRAAAELEAAADEVGVPAYWRRRLSARAAALASPASAVAVDEGTGK